MASAKDYTIAKLATVTGINAKTVAQTTLLRVPIGKSFVPDHFVIRVTTLTGAKSIQVVAAFGGTAAWNDCVGSATYTTTASVTFIRVPILTTVIPIYAAAAYVKIDITTGSDAATAETWAIDVWGYLL